MRRLVLAVAVAVLAAVSACKDDPVAPRENATVIFRAAANCPTGTVELTLDGVVKGQYQMRPNSTVQSFGVAAGNHTAGAREIGGSGLAWLDLNFNVQANQTVTLNLPCP
jgi:hypothetical protein